MKDDERSREELINELNRLRTEAAKYREINEQHRQIQEALISANQQLNDIIEFLPDATFVIDRNKRVIAWNRAIEEMTGVTKKEMIGQGDYAYTVPFYGERRQHLLDLIDVSDAELELKYRYVKKIGNVLRAETYVPCVYGGNGAYVFATGAPLFDVHGNCVGAIESIRDISDQKMAEERLRESEQKYRNLVESTVDWVWTCDVGGCYTFSNEAVEQLLGYRSGEIIGGLCFSLIHPDDRERVMNWFNAAVIKKRGWRNSSVRWQHKDGSTKLFESSARRILDSEGNLIGFSGIDRDITARIKAQEEKQRLQQQIQNSQKMEAIATLAGGIAHEFNNALCAISGNIDLINMERPHDVELRQYLEPMRRSSQRMARLTSQLLAYARGGKYQAHNIPLNDFVEETLTLIQHSIPPEISVELSTREDSLLVNIDLTQMQMALTAVVVNAAESIEVGGLVKVSTRKENSTEGYPVDSALGVDPGCYVCIGIEDNGKGMDKQTKDKVFEPFFTTKYQGRGLGMAAAHGIVKNHGGWISIDSMLGSGTVVKIYLPASEAAPEPSQKPKDDLMRGSGTVLIIEDEEMIMNLNRTVLARMGYTVLQARTGRDAVKIAESHAGDIDLIILDLGLPDMPGDKVYRTIKELRPDLKALIVSGYALEDSAQDVLEAGADAFIQKPFPLSTLTVKLKALLGIDK